MDLSINKQISQWEFVCKSVDEEQRTLRGWATTRSPDRGGDVVEPKGLRFNKEIPLFLYHDSRMQVGNARLGEPTAKGVPFEAYLPKIAEPGNLQDMVNEAWQRVKYNLIRFVSIGFLPNFDKVEQLKGGGNRFLEAEVLELSLVPVPMQPEAAINYIKSIDQSLRAAQGTDVKQGQHLSTSPGASGFKPVSLIPKGKTMTLSEREVGLANTRAAHVARMTELDELAAKEGRTFNEQEQDEFENLDSQVASVEKQLASVRRMSELNKQTLVPIAPDTGINTLPKHQEPIPSYGIGVRVKTNLEPGVKLARYAMSLYRARGNVTDALSIYQSNKRWMDTAPEVVTVMKGAIAAGDTTTAGWASELVYAQNLANEFIEYLRPKTIIGRIPNLRMVPFNIRVGGMSAGSTGYWVGQGKPIPLSKPTTTSTTLGMMKAAGIVPITEELAMSSSPSAELMVRDDLANAVQATIDTQFINPNYGGVANISPASVLYGVTPTTASNTTLAAIITDVKAVFSAAITAELDIASAVWVMSPTTALSLSLMTNSLGQQEFPGMTINGGTWQGLPVIVSSQATISGSPQYGNIIALIFPREIFVADEGGVTIAVSNETALELLDNPTNTSTGSTVATSMVSMFQTDSLAVRAIRFITWAKRRTAAAAFIQAANYG